MTDLTIGRNDREKDPLLRGLTTTGDLFGEMLAAHVDESGNKIPPPDLSKHPTRGLCTSCRQPMPRAWIAFCGGWTPLRQCDEHVRNLYGKTHREAISGEDNNPEATKPAQWKPYNHRVEPVELVAQHPQ